MIRCLLSYLYFLIASLAVEYVVSYNSHADEWFGAATLFVSAPFLAPINTIFLIVCDMTDVFKGIFRSPLTIFAESIVVSYVVFEMMGHSSTIPNYMFLWLFLSTFRVLFILLFLLNRLLLRIHPGLQDKLKKSVVAEFIIVLLFILVFPLLFIAASLFGNFGKIALVIIFGYIFLLLGIAGFILYKYPEKFSVWT